MLRILHTNDFHGMLDERRESRLAELREGADLYFDCGDAIKSGNLAIPLKPDPVWERLERLRCSASVLGNRETHPLDMPWRAKIAGAEHPLLCANLTRQADGSHPLPGSLQFEVSGLKVGVFGVMVPMVTKRMATRAASQFLWDDPLAIAELLVRELRADVDCLIALTHIGLSQDRRLAEHCPDVDLILGGHSHDMLSEPERVGTVGICQTGSYGRFAGLYGWLPGRGIVEHKLVPLS